MKITFDSEANALMILLKEGVPFHKDRLINDHFILNLDEHGEVVGIEILHASAYVDAPNQVTLADITHHNKQAPR